MDPVITPTTPTPPAPPPYVAPLSLRGVRVMDVLAWLIFALGVYSAIKGGTPIPAPPPLPQAAAPVTQHFYGYAPPTPTITAVK